MRARLSCAMVVAVLAISGSALADAVDESWTTATAPNGGYTVATPCTVAQIEAYRAVPPAGPFADIREGTRVMCRRGDLILVAGEVAVDTAATPGAMLFDELVAAARADQTAEGDPTVTQLQGRRAFVNRQTRDGIVAQTGFVEVGNRRVLMLIAGNATSGGMTVSQQGTMIDRFYGSVRVIPH